MEGILKNNQLWNLIKIHADEQTDMTKLTVAFFSQFSTRAQTGQGYFIKNGTDMWNYFSRNS
jgi:hypothetical protein